MRARDANRANRDPLSPAGFTLIEVLVALTISSLVLLGARALIDGLADSAKQIRSSATFVDRESNAERTLRLLVGNADVGVSGRQIAGTATEAQFRSWCMTARGWHRRCTVRLTVLKGTRAEPSLVVVTSSGDRFRVTEVETALPLRYLVSAANGGIWSSEWTTAGEAPLAIGVVRERDTLLLRTGEQPR